MGRERRGLALFQRAPERLEQVLSSEMLSPESAELTTCTQIHTISYSQEARACGNQATF